MADNYKAMSDREDERREPAQPTMQQKYAEYKTSTTTPYLSHGQGT